MPETNDQTQIQTGDEQEGPGTSALEQQLASVNQQLRALQTQQDQTEQQRRRQQARADRIEAANRARRLATQARPPVQAARQATPPGQQTQAPPDEAVETEQELALLQRAVQHGLDEDEINHLRDLPWSTDYELDLQLNILTTQKEVKKLQAQLSNKEGTEDGPPSVDLGGRTEGEANQETQELHDIRVRANEELGSQRYKEATWLTLAAIHRDPSKRLPK